MAIGIPGLWLTTAAFAVAAPAAAQSQWEMAPPLPKPIGEIMGVVVGDQWFVLAGLDAASHKPMGVVYAFDVARGTWIEKKPMPQPAHHVMATALAGKIYVFGGFVSPQAGSPETAESGWQPTGAAWMYDPAPEAWKELAPMPTPRGAGWAAASNGKI
jgi:N-acetylneuraminic acid mutarotase